MDQIDTYEVEHIAQTVVEDALNNLQISLDLNYTFQNEELEVTVTLADQNGLVISTDMKRIAVRLSDDGY